MDGDYKARFGAEHSGNSPAAQRSRANRLRQVAWLGRETDASLHGVHRYMAEQRSWALHYQWEYLDEEWATWKGDGIFISGELTPFIHIIKQIRIPIVTINLPQATALPCVADDHAAIGVLAAEHLLERGVRNFGYCGSYGVAKYDFSIRRHDACVQRLRQAGFSCSDFDFADMKTLPTLLAQWLATLPKPCGIVCDSYFLGKAVLSACRCQSLAIPEEVAIITVKTEEHEVGPPEQIPLSYVKLNTRRKGYEGAALLDRLMSGDRVAPGTILSIAPQGVEPRQSTDILTMPDAHVAAALRYIWQHACEGIQIKDVLRVVPLSRRVFEQRFEKIIGCTPHEKIMLERLNRAKLLLRETTTPLKQIAEDCGFTRVEHLITTFRQKTGVSPNKYRLLNGAKSVFL